MIFYLCVIDVTWQPWRVDWNVHVWTMMTSLYYSVGVVDTVEWARVLCDHRIQVTEWVEQQICIKFCVKLGHSSTELFGRFRRLQLWATGAWQLYHHGVPAHASRLMQSSLAKHQITQLTQLPYSPDLAPCNFWLFPKLKLPLKGKRSQIINEIQETDNNWENCVRSQGA